MKIYSIEFMIKEVFYRVIKINVIWGNIKIPIKILRDSYYGIKNYVMENIFLFNLIYS